LVINSSSIYNTHNPNFHHQELQYCRVQLSCINCMPRELNHFREWLQQQNSNPVSNSNRRRRLIAGPSFRSNACRKVVLSPPLFFFWAGYIYSQKSILKIKSTKRRFFFEIFIRKIFPRNKKKVLQIFIHGSIM
jgi:hypothetical protein